MPGITRRQTASVSTHVNFAADDKTKLKQLNKVSEQSCYEIQNNTTFYDANCSSQELGYSVTTVDRIIAEHRQQQNLDTIYLTY